MKYVSPELPQVAISTLVHADTVVQRGPCIVLAVIVTGNGAAAEVDIYDGTSDKGDHKAKILALNSTTSSWTLATGTDFDHGIFVHVNATTTYVTITYIPESYKKYV